MGQKKRKPKLKKVVAIIFTILFLDTILIILKNLYKLNLEILSFNAGFTFLILSIITSLVVNMRKKLKTDETILIGAVSLLLRSAFSISISSLFGGEYKSVFILLLLLRDFILGFSFGAFSNWFVDKVIK